MDLSEYTDQVIRNVEQEGCRRRLKVLAQGQAAEIIVEGRRLINFCSNNYLGLANDPRLGQAAVASIQTAGWGSGASRLVCGHMRAHQELETQIARFKGAESSLVFSTGYMANIGIIASLFGRDDILFADRLNHASIIDGIKLSQATFKRYPHNDLAVLETWLKKFTGYKKRAIITDSVFSMDGDISSLDQIVELARRYECAVMIDEAHALGVMGENGKGLAEHFEVGDQIDIQMGTLSKAVGSFGAYVCGRRSLIDFFVQKARSFIYTTALPPAVAAASSKGLEIIAQEPERRQQLWAHTRYVQKSLRQMGFDIGQTQTPIIPVIVKENALAVSFSKQLWDAGFFISCIRPPTVPRHTARLRITLMATHTQQQVDQLLKTMQQIGHSLKVI